MMKAASMAWVPAIAADARRNRRDESIRCLSGIKGLEPARTPVLAGRHRARR